jgi:WD40 repeat protein
LKDRKEILRRQARAPVTAVALRDSGVFATGGQDSSVSLWQREPSGGFKENVLQSNRSQADPPIIMDLVFSPDGRRLAAGDNTNRVDLWDTASLRHLRTWKVPGGATNLAFSPDSRQIAVVNGGDGQITLLDPDRDEVPRAKSGDCGRVFSVAFRDEGRSLVTGCKDGLLEQIEINPWRSLGQLSTRGDFVFSLATCQDASILAAGTADGRVLLWDLDPASWKRRACRRVNSEFPEDLRTRAGLPPGLCRKLLQDAPPEPPGIHLEKKPEEPGIPDNVAGG